MMLGDGIVHRLRRPGRIGETAHPPGSLGARSIRFAGVRVLRPLRTVEPVATGPAPGRTLAAAVRTEIPVHRLLQVQAAGSMALAPKLLAPQPQA